MEDMEVTPEVMVAADFLVGTEGHQAVVVVDLEEMQVDMAAEDPLVAMGDLQVVVGEDQGDRQKDVEVVMDHQEVEDQKVDLKVMEAANPEENPRDHPDFLKVGEQDLF